MHTFFCDKRDLHSGVPHAVVRYQPTRAHRMRHACCHHASLHCLRMQTSDDEGALLIDDHTHARDNSGAAAHPSNGGHGTVAVHAVAPQHLDHGNGRQAAAESFHRVHQQQHEQQHGQQERVPAAAAAQPLSADQTVDPSQLFPSRHVPRWTPLLIAYFPLGDNCSGFAHSML